MNLINAVSTTVSDGSSAALAPKASAAGKTQSGPSTTATQPSSASPKQDSVSLSSVALAALKESTETPAQTASEAAHGDRQAKRLLAKQNVVHQSVVTQVK
jgi:hypothetical protein